MKIRVLNVKVYNYIPFILNSFLNMFLNEIEIYV